MSADERGGRVRASAPRGPGDNEAVTPGSAVQVTKGEPTDEELGALSVVLAAVLAESAAHENQDRAQLSGWKSYWGVIRQPLMPGREAWGSSLR